MVADIQERLTYLAQVYVLDSISTFKPADKDIDYPNILMGVNADSTPKYAALDVALYRDIPSNPQANNLSTLQDLYFTWYPTLKRTLVCLSKLYRCVEVRACCCWLSLSLLWLTSSALAKQPSIFEGLAQEAVSECSNSLFRAASLINANKVQRIARWQASKQTSGWVARSHARNIMNLQGFIDAQLFLIRHLLILREQITPFDIEVRTKHSLLALTTSPPRC